MLYLQPRHLRLIIIRCNLNTVYNYDCVTEATPILASAFRHPGFKPKHSVLMAKNHSLLVANCAHKSTKQVTVRDHIYGGHHYSILA